jgi:hypothetical protein
MGDSNDSFSVFSKIPKALSKVHPNPNLMSQFAISSYETPPGLIGT